MVEFYTCIATSFFIAFTVTFFLIPFLSLIAPRIGAIDLPDGKLKTHKIATPYLGGLGICLGFVTSVLLLLPINNRLLLFIIGSIFLLIVGLIDDLITLKPYQKFGGQILASLYFLKAGLYFKSDLFGSWGIIISFFWFLSIINAFNLVDVMDGLAAVLAFGSLCPFLFLAFFFRDFQLLVLLAAFTGALLAFFWYNKPSAKIYLGDAGSLLLGGFCAALPFFFPWGIYNLYGFLAPIGFFAIVLLELLALILIRLYKRIPFYQGSPDHFSHYLRKRGWTPSQILIFSFSMSLIASGVAILFMFNIISFAQTVLVTFAFFLFWTYLTYKTLLF